MEEKILILDFGSQYTQLIARRIRELQVYSEIHPYNYLPSSFQGFKGIILSGSPCSVLDSEAPAPQQAIFDAGLPILGICYGAQWMAHWFGGNMLPSKVREYGRAHLNLETPSALFHGIDSGSQIWMSHGDTIGEIGADFRLTATTQEIPIAAFEHKEKPFFGIQFHPEVVHSEDGETLLFNFVRSICGCNPSWTPASFIDATIASLKANIGQSKVVMGLSGGVDSTVAATLLHQAIGSNLHCIFVDNGLLRKGEYHQVLDSYLHLGLNVKGVDASEQFYSALKGLSDPEQKRKAIGRVFIEVFEAEANSIEGVAWLGQGTIYPDVIESVSVNGPSVTIKSHHNVGGLPDRMNLKVVEPLRLLFKDEVRGVGKELGLSHSLLGRHPFPGPGLAIRILGDITPQKVQLLQEADHIFIQALRDDDWYHKVWQAGAILLPVYAVGVMGDERTYEQVVALRAVSSQDGMTADWVEFPHQFLAKVSNQIINQVKGINRVVYDISSKPPATIEWE